nr:protein FAR1-RELATED SEQUENCE 5-like [Ipomoea batatas]
MHVKPRDILTSVKRQNPNNVSTTKTIYNGPQKFRMLEKAGKTQIQVVMSYNGYVHESCTNNVTNELEDLFFVHPKSLEKWRAFPHVLLIDVTYKTNRYSMPLVEMVGVTSTNMTFCIAFVFIHKENESNYNWALNCLKATIEGCITPRVIVTDRELALMKACKNVYPEAKGLLCRWHIYRSILRKCRSSITSSHHSQRPMYWWSRYRF